MAGAKATLVDRRAGWVLIERGAIEGYMREAGASAWMVYTYLVYCADAVTAPFPTLKAIVDATGLTAPTVRTATRRLIELGLIGRVQEKIICSRGGADGKMILPVRSDSAENGFTIAALNQAQSGAAAENGFTLGGRGGSNSYVGNHVSTGEEERGILTDSCPAGANHFPFAPVKAKAPALDTGPLWEVCIALNGGRRPETKSEEGRWAQVIGDMARRGVTPEELRRRGEAAIADWGKFYIGGLASNFSTYANGAARSGSRAGLPATAPAEVRAMVNRAARRGAAE